MRITRAGSTFRGNAMRDLKKRCTSDPIRRLPKGDLLGNLGYRTPDGVWSTKPR